MNKLKQEDVLKTISMFQNKTYEQPKREYPCAGNIPKDSRNFIDKIEYFLYKRGFYTGRMFCKWQETSVNEEISNIPLDTDNLEAYKE